MSPKLKKLCPDLFQFDSGKEGPTVTILGGVHGSEKPGIEVVRALIGLFMTKPSLIQRGRINVGIGNPAAVQKGERFVEHDLNRSLGELPPGLQGCIEARRAAVLKPILADTDVLIDIHSTLKPSDPMVLSPTCLDDPTDERSAMLRRLLPIFGIKNVLTGDGLASGSTGVCTDTYVWQQGGLGICLETGWQEDQTAVPRIQRSVLKALEEIGISPSSDDTEPLMPFEDLNLFDAYWSVPASSQFRFMKKYDNFEFVPKGTHFATDGTQELITPCDSYMVFQKDPQRLKPGVEACLLLRKKECNSP